jgi:hypothetical protein
MAMLAVGGDDGIFRLQRLHRANGDRFLADVEMNEAADLARGVKFDAFFFEAANAQHLFEQMHSVLAIDGSGILFCSSH